MSLLLLLNNDPEPLPFSGDGTLFISGSEGAVDFSSQTLYTQGSDSSLGNCDLYILGNVLTSINSNIDLYTVNASLINSNVPLFISGIPIDGFITLYTHGVEALNTSLNLFVKSPDVKLSNNNIPLTLVGSGVGINSQFAGLDLYIKATFGTGMNLFLKSVEEATLVNNLNLFLEGDGLGYQEIMSTMYMAFYIRMLNELYGGIENSTFEKFSLRDMEDIRSNHTATLFIKGKALDPISMNSNLNLYINRPIGDAISLFLEGPATSLNYTIPLLINGAYYYDGSLGLVIPSTTGLTTKAVKLYTHGF